MYIWYVLFHRNMICLYNAYTVYVGHKTVFITNIIIDANPPLYCIVYCRYILRDINIYFCIYRKARKY